MGALAGTLARMRGQRVYVDANYFIYFLEGRTEFFEPAAEVLRACDRGEMIGMTGDATLAEVLVRPYREDDAAMVARIKRLFARESFVKLLAHDRETFDLAAQLRAKHGAKMADALHHATAVRAGCRFLLTNDHSFKSDDNLEIVALRDLVQ